MDDRCTAGLRMQLQLLRKLDRLMAAMSKLLYYLTTCGWWQDLGPVEMIFSSQKDTPRHARLMVRVSGLTLQILFFIATEQLVGLSSGCGNGRSKTATKP